VVVPDGPRGPRCRAKSGVIHERVQLPDDSPVIHCAKMVGDYMYFCDDMGWMARFRI